MVLDRSALSIVQNNFKNVKITIMKPFFISLILFIINSNCNGQLEQNTWLVGGSGSYYKYTEDFSSQPASYIIKARSIDISASIGYFVLNRMALGMRPYFNGFKSEVSGEKGQNYYRVSVGPFARYYFLDGERRTNLLLDIGYQLGLNRDFPTDITFKGKDNIFSAMGGVEFFFNTAAGMDILFGYVNKMLSIDNAPIQVNQLSNIKGFQFSIGFQLHLEKN